MSPLRVDIDSQHLLKQVSRVLIVGATLAGKSNGIYTFPGPISVAVAPGEQGWSTFEPSDNMHLAYWETEAGKPIQHREALAAIDRHISDTLAGKLGTIKTFCLDGLPNYYDALKITMGWTPGCDSKIFGDIHGEFRNRLSRILSSSIPIVVCTCWDGKEAAEPGGPVNQVWADLPGVMAKKVIGDFPLTFYAERRAAAPEDRYFWRLRPTGKIQAAGLHVPPRILRQLPNEIEIVVAKDGTVSGGWQTFEAAFLKAINSGGQT